MPREVSGEIACVRTRQASDAVALCMSRHVEDVPVWDSGLGTADFPGAGICAGNDASVLLELSKTFSEI